MTNYFLPLFSYYLIAFSMLIATSYTKNLFKYRLAAKTATSLGFIAIAWYSGFASGNIGLFLHLLPAFIFCLAGDIFLGVTNKDGSKKVFIFGLLAFLTGHILFAVGFNLIAPFALSELILPLASLPLAMFLTNLKRMKTGRMKKYILAYSFFVTLLFSKGISIFSLNQGIFGVLVLFGTLFFLISDFIILFLYFYEDKHPLTSFANLFTYYLATFLLSFSLYFY